MGGSDLILSFMGVVTGTQEITKFPGSLQGLQISLTQIRRGKVELLRKLQTRTFLSHPLLGRILRFRPRLGRKREIPGDLVRSSVTQSTHQGRAAFSKILSLRVQQLA